jgi:hypothetical protein
MAGKFLRAAVALALLAVPAFSQGRGGAGKAAAGDAPAKPSEPTPRWPDGHVNLGSTAEYKGYWEVRPGLGGFPRPDAVPFQPWAKAVYEHRTATFSRESPLVDCKAAPGPAFLNAPGFEFVDVPELKSIFVVNIAGPHTWRVIYMDGRPHPQGEDVRPTYLGHSVGHWEGDTLVVDTTGFNDRSWLGVIPHTEQLHIVQRYRRPDLGHLQKDVTIEDPGAFTQPWTFRVNWELAPGEEVMEMVCESNNYEQHVPRN